MKMYILDIQTQKLVNFKGENIQPGEFVEVEITDAKSFSLDGVAV